MSRSLEADKVFWIKDIQLTDHLQLKAWRDNFNDFYALLY